MIIKITTVAGERELLLPLCSACRFLSLEQYQQELSRHGFRILSAVHDGGVNCPQEAVMVAEKP